MTYHAKKERERRWREQPLMSRVRSEQLQIREIKTGFILFNVLKQINTTIWKRKMPQLPQMAPLTPWGKLSNNDTFFFKDIFSQTYVMDALL